MMKKFAVVAGLLAALIASSSVRAEILEQVLVKVNGDIVTKGDFERLQVEFLRQRPDLQNVTSDSPELQKAVAASTPQLILNAVDELLHQEVPVHRRDPLRNEKGRVTHPGGRATRPSERRSNRPASSCRRRRS